MMHRIRAVITYIAVLIPVTVSAVNISGYAVDGRSGEGIPGVNVMILGSDLGGSTDLDGFFVVRRSAAGPQEIRVSHIAYRDTVIRLESLEKDLFLGHIRLEGAAVTMEGVEVVADRDELLDRDLNIGAFRVDPDMLRDIPALQKDVFRAIRYSPSVTVSSPFSPQYNVRGSDSGENMVLLDGMTIYNPQHFMGSAAVFNPYAIKSIEMLPGGFDAEYGGRNASILLVTTREGSQEEIHGEFRPSLSGISGAIEFPVAERSSAMLSGRLLTDLSTRVLMGSPNFMGDLNAAMRYQGKTQDLRVSLFLARDYMDYSIDGLMLYFPKNVFSRLEEGFTANTFNGAAGFRLRSVLHPSLLWENQIFRSESRVDNFTLFGYEAVDSSSALGIGLDFRTRIENQILDHSWKSGISWYLPHNISLKTGMELSSLLFRNEMGRLSGDPDPEEHFELLSALYIQSGYEVQRLKIKSGLRANRIREGMWRIDPRLNAAISVRSWTIKGSYGIYSQQLTTLDSKNDEFVQFLEYYNSLGGLEPIRSTHYILNAGREAAGLQWNFTLYYKDLHRLYRSSYEPGTGGAAELIAGEGEAYGSEISVHVDRGALRGWFSYQYSRGFRRYPGVYGGRTHIFDGDQPHSFKSVLSYDISTDISASSTFIFSSGYPRTWESGMYLHYGYDAFDNRLLAYSSTYTPELNNVRYPPRLDWEIGWKKRLRTGFGNDLAQYLGLDGAYFTTTIRNILFLHRDPVYYMYIPDFGYYGLDMEFLPSVSVGYSLVF